MPEFAYGSGPPQPVAPMKPEKLADGVTLVRPLSRKGSGPGLILLTSNAEPAVEIQDGIPSLRMKWAEEGYVVVEIGQQASISALKLAVTKLDECRECEPKEKIGLVCYDAGLWSKAASTVETLKDRIVVSVIYATANEYPSISTQAPVPTIYHLTGTPETKLQKHADSKIYEYASSSNASFPIPFTKDFHYATEAVSHSRNLAFLKKHMGGPTFDLELLWDEHTFYEFGDRSVENTMATMVEEPYVNHVPTLTGGIGRKALTDFYTNHFIFSNPKDTELELISRTVGIDRVVDEFIYKFTHDMMVDWLFPGVPPTFKYVEIPMMAVVNIRGDRLYHEHITWDQGTALRQIGVLPERLSLSVEEGSKAQTNGDGEKGGSKVFDVVVPVAGTETVAKMRDKNSVESNHMFQFEARRV